MESPTRGTRKAAGVQGLLWVKVHSFCFAILLIDRWGFRGSLWVFSSSFEGCFRGRSSCLCLQCVLLHFLGWEELPFASNWKVFLHSGCFAAIRFLFNVRLRISSDTAFPRQNPSVTSCILGLLTGISCCVHLPEMAFCTWGAHWGLGSSTIALTSRAPSFCGYSRLAAAPLCRSTGSGSLLQQRAEPWVALVGIGRTASVAQGITNVTVRAYRDARVLLLLLLDWSGWRGVIYRCEWESTLAVPQALRGVESGWWSCVWPGWMRNRGRGEALRLWAGTVLTGAFCLHRLDLKPLQLQKPLQVLLQGPHRLGSGGTSAFSMKKQGQLSQAPAVKWRWQEVRVSVARFPALVIVTIIVSDSTGSREIWRKVMSVDDLSPEVEVRRGTRGAGGGQHRQPLGIWQITGTVTVNILLVEVLL